MATGHSSQVVKRCSECNAAFQSVYSQAKTCGKLCSAAREAEMSRERSAKWVVANKERFDATCAAYRAANRESRASYQREYARENADQCAIASRDYRAKNAAKMKKWQAEHYKANPEPAKMRARRRKAILRSAGRAFLVTQRDLDRLVARHGGRCAYCRNSLDGGMHFDHVFPLSKGGNHSVGNLLPTCARCNLSKHASLLIEWRMKHHRLGWSDVAFL